VSHGPIQHDRLAFHDPRAEIRNRPIRRELDHDRFAKDARLATDRDRFSTAGALHDHVVHHAQDPLGRLNDRKPNMTATTRHEHLGDGVQPDYSLNFWGWLTRTQRLVNPTSQGECRRALEAAGYLFPRLWGHDWLESETCVPSK
jgi:hypothetical protein